MSGTDPCEAEWLAGPEAASWLEEVGGAPPTPRLVAKLRGALPPSRVALLLEIAEARSRSRAKFARGERLLLTRRGLEQATDQWIAAYKAARFAKFGPVLDIGCGVGGDLMALARRAGVPPLAIERDQTLAVFAAHNVLVSGGVAELRTRSADRADVAACDAWHADPDRRLAGRRTVQLSQSQPALEELETWIKARGDFALKLAPAAETPEAWEAEAELEWISRGGECRQLVVWGGRLAQTPGQRRATCVPSQSLPDVSAVGTTSGGLVPTFVGNPRVPLEQVKRVAEWVYEPDPAILAAGLTGALAAKHGLAAFAQVAYLTGPARVADPLLSAFRVLEILPLQRSRLAQWLKQRDVGRLEIKCRGVPIDPAALRKELKPRGDAALTLLIAPGQGQASRRQGKPLVIAAERVAS
ncbi:class I SAM-dependent methyltransferase [Botrimarina hoheduenensis]|uniref:THUMP-like domain-containing protein n=1 Tax=Botrimarina hoheduenensis TaxID=2528000 RepID=A0A5C5VVZ4_9BACT|nr:class I SAM-dependent methyltransferase [Botrimarina hoheduenensis]TWT42846.1 hypothetical protein Pla111_24840 [Botrimarina hoheduenensis]